MLSMSATATGQPPSLAESLPADLWPMGSILRPLKSLESRTMLDPMFMCRHEHYKGAPKPAWRWQDWRGIAGAEQLEKREKTLSIHNNYDGRNYITE